MATRKKAQAGLPLKDEENNQPIPLVWRETLTKVVSAFAKGDFELACGVESVDPIIAEQAERFRKAVLDYNGTLVELGEETWESSVTQWYDPYWDFLLDLWTEEEGPSDLVLSGRVTEAPGGYRFTLNLVYVP